MTHSSGRRGWRLPVLWFQVKGFVGSRSFDITALRVEQLQDGCIFNPAETTKGREDRPAPLPPALYQELLAVAGPTYVFETFHTGLRECYKRNALRCGNYTCQTFSPRRVVVQFGVLDAGFTVPNGANCTTTLGGSARRRGDRLGERAISVMAIYKASDPLVDTGATMLSLLQRVVQQLGLQRHRTRNARTSAGSFSFGIYEPVRLTVLDRDCVIEVAEVADDCPVLIGQVPLELLDLVVDPAGRRLIGNPEHGGEHMIEMY